MSVRVALTHRTKYQYARAVSLGPQVIRLRPAPHNRTPLHSYSLKIEPEEHFINWLQDPYGNYLARVVLPEKTKEFEVTVHLVADLESYNPFDFFLEPQAEEFPFVYSEEDTLNLAPFLEKENEEPGELLQQLIEDVDLTKRRTVDFLVELNQQVFELVDYVIRMEPGVQTPEETLESGRGSCRDSAWLLVQLCRHLGLAARFVSGYLVQLEPAERPLDGHPGAEVDFTDLHAWTEVYVPGAGWIGLDATSGLLTAEGHIPVACTPRPQSAAPIEGGVEKVETKFDFEMKVERIVDVPRITKPYTEEQWAEILEVGEEADARLIRQDIRLTMGGEPTFVSEQNPDADEWNTAALGDEKFQVADQLGRRLQKLWSPGALFHHGQGKWYPGEQLPRWAISIVHRKDGEALWQNPDHFARTGSSENATSADGQRFLRKLASLLDVPDEGLMPAYEDVWYYLWKERRLPGNVDPLDNHLEDPLERERLAKVFRQGLGEVVGYVLPLGHDEDTFRSGRWFLREEHCFLYPGDSPIGYRLPLDSLPFYHPHDSQAAPPRDPTALSRQPLPRQPHLPRQQPRRGSREYSQKDGKKREQNSFSPPAQRPDPGPGILATALCAEVREGILHIFLPPLESAEAFVQLASALEQTCEETGLKVQLEGYPPPFDPRLSTFKLTPDPGVLEVNIPPVESFQEQVQQTEELYATARELKLRAEKFDIDGRHIGSGGGNHVVLGAERPLDSAFLRKPDLLRSFLSFWQNHPSLSFLFSGQFIGPTSQSPRIDEARNDSLHELQIAFDQLDQRTQLGEATPPWLIDRIFRNLLIDVTGNTHRTEFCIDKLYSPDSSSGRLGLLEMRGFEMPPHHRMATAQHLLVRSLLASFAEQPYREALVPWGTSLHDKFMLPHFVKRDLRDVVRYLQDRNFGFSDEFFEPHYQFRFPYYGHIVKDDISIELRGALEPWHVLGEESAAGGQARYVDSSVERLQIRVRGATHDRHAITCNGALVPLHPTGTHGEYVAGVRYRAWQPPSCLHPTIGVDGPLHFDLFDRWNRRAIAGCTYHVVHPGGRSAEDRPVNAVAAESRRIARFEHAGVQARAFEPVDQGIDPDFPFTLDLRKVAPY
ncbi:MAG: transglutaminase family protein [Polyangiaceae bacterium]|nr:transglutaminase family protein [Polyangiaceae bacterium]